MVNVQDVTNSACIWSKIAAKRKKTELKLKPFQLTILMSFEPLWMQMATSSLLCMHQPGIEPGSVPWQGTILPLDHWCCWEICLCISTWRWRIGKGHNFQVIIHLFVDWIFFQSWNWNTSSHNLLLKINKIILSFLFKICPHCFTNNS